MPFTAGQVPWISMGTNLQRLSEFYKVMEDKREERQKKEANHFKILQSYADEMGYAPKDATTPMDSGSLEGLIKANETKRTFQDQEVQNLLRLAQIGKLTEESRQNKHMAGAAGAFSNALVEPDADPIKALAGAVGQYPYAATDPRFGGLASLAKDMRPPDYEYTTLLGLKRKAEAAGDTVLAGEYQARMDAINTKGKRTTRVNPQTGEVEIIEGGDAGPTSGAKSAFEKRLVQFEMAHNSLTELERILDPSMVGVRGVFGEYVLDRALGQFAPTVDKKRVAGRAKLKAAIQGMVRLISSDDRFSNEDRKRAEAVMADSGALESYERSMEVLGTLKEIFSRNASTTAKHAGVERPAYTLSPEEISARVRAQEISLEEGERLLDLYHPNFKP